MAREPFPEPPGTHSAQLTALELATHTVVGPGGDGTGRTAPAGNPVAALEDAIRPALQRGRCLVSFSGGHDSSLVLGIATRLARADGLPLPVPITWRFPDAPRSHESEIQDEVVAALGLPDWVRLTAGDELDLVGPVAQRTLRRHGVLFPFNTFLHAPLLERAAGGTLLTGVGGDQLFMRSHRPRRPWLLAPPLPGTEGYSWLRRRAARAVHWRVARERRRMPRDAMRRPRQRMQGRALALTRRSFELVAGDHGALAEHPLLDPRLLSAIEGTGVSPNAAGGRPALLAYLFGDVLPEPVLRARRKAAFDEVFWTRHAREHIRSWDGSGVDASVVDRAGLRRWWQRDRQPIFTALLAQQTWLSAHAHEPSETRGAT